MRGYVDARGWGPFVNPEHEFKNIVLFSLKLSHLC